MTSKIHKTMATRAHPLMIMMVVTSWLMAKVMGTREMMTLKERGIIHHLHLMEKLIVSARVF